MGVSKLKCAYHTARSEGWQIRLFERKIKAEMLNPKEIHSLRKN